jgi:hypothetical protein
MKNKVSFKKIESGKYKLMLNGAEMLTISKGSYTWMVYGQTDAFVEFYDKLDRYSNGMVDSLSYSTKNEAKACFEFAANSIS